MKHNRTTLLQAINRVLTCTNAEERADFARAAHEALDSYLAAKPFLDEPPDTELHGEVARKQLGPAPMPIRGLDDAALRELNQLLPWATMTADPAGRILGAPWSSKKRAQIQGLVDRRHRAFAKYHPLAGRHVAEFGCFEGIHTISLLLAGAQVTAIDGRIANVLKTMARLWAYGRKAEVLHWDLEQAPPEVLPEGWDVTHHIGVLYHLSNPVEHLDEILPRTRQALLLDTHVATSAEEAPESYEVGGRSFRFQRVGEPQAETSPFAGLRDHAKYLVLEELMAHIGRHGFAEVQVAEDRSERNGRRVTLWARR